ASAAGQPHFARAAGSPSLPASSGAAASPDAHSSAPTASGPAPASSPGTITHPPATTSEASPDRASTTSDRRAMPADFRGTTTAGEPARGRGASVPAPVRRLVATKGAVGLGPARTGADEQSLPTLVRREPAAGPGWLAARTPMWFGPITRVARALRSRPGEI